MLHLKIKEKIYNAYIKDGGYTRALKIADNHNLPFEYCPQCENEMPVLNNTEHECLICGTTTTNKYFQPEFTEDGAIKGHEDDAIFSFEVWRKKENLLKDYPNCTPIEYINGDIENPNFVD